MTNTSTRSGSETIEISKDEYRKLQQESTILRTIRAHTQVTYYIFTIGGKILLQSDNLARLAGWSVDEALSGHVARHANKEDMSNLMDAVKNASANPGEGARTEYAMSRKDGSPIHVRTTIVDLTDTAEIDGFLGVSETIDRQHQLEVENKALKAQLVRVQKLDAIGTLASGIAHDFNNVLQAVIGNTDLVLCSLPENSEYQKYLEHVMKAGRTGQNLVTKLLTFARKRPPVMQVVELKPCVEDAISLLKVVLSPGVALKTAIDDEIGYLFDDPVNVQQILLNLGTNAINAVEEGLISEGGISDGGEVWISLKRVSVTAGRPAAIGSLRAQAYAKLSVGDNGVGMDEQTISRIFQPFFTTRGQGQGTGLGLAVVAGIVETQEGALDIRSTPQMGTVFDVYLPLISKEEAMNRRIDDIAPEGTETVAVIDDDPGVLFVVSNFLERLGYSVIHYTSAVNFLHEVAADMHLFDVVVTDLTMPELSGVQLARKLAKYHPALPVVLTSGFDEPLHNVTSPPPSIRMVLRKPYGAVELGRIIQRIVRGQLPE